MSEVRVTKEKQEKNTFDADCYRVSFTDKALAKIKEKGTIDEIPARVFRKAKPQPDADIPPFEDIGAIYAADVIALADAVVAAVKKISTAEL